MTGQPYSGILRHMGDDHRHLSGALVEYSAYEYAVAGASLIYGSAACALSGNRSIPRSVAVTEASTMVVRSSGLAAGVHDCATLLYRAPRRGFTAQDPAPN